MVEREGIVEELWGRIASAEGVKHTARNPTGLPSSDDFPAVLLFEWPDKVVAEEARGRTKMPVYRRKMSVNLEIFIKGTSEGASSHELTLFVCAVKKEIYRGGNSLGGRAIIKETNSSSLIRPNIGANAAAISIEFEIEYVENTQLFS